MTRAAAAAALGVAPARINRWVEDGAPVAVRGSRGHSAMYDLEALRAWKDARSAGPTPDLGGLSLAQERAKLARAQREKWELENRLRSGAVLPREAVLADGRAVVAALRARMLTLARQAVMRGIIPREHEPALRALVVEALRELARWRTLEDLQHVEAVAEAAVAPGIAS